MRQKAWTQSEAEYEGKADEVIKSKNLRKAGDKTCHISHQR